VPQVSRRTNESVLRHRIGLVTSTLLTLVVMPAAYGWIEGMHRRRLDVAGLEG